MTISDLEGIQILQDEELKSNWSETLYKQELLDFNTIAFVLILDDQLVGFVLGKMLVDSSDLYQIVISKNAQGKGLGTLLLQAYWDEVIKRGGNASILEVNSKHKEVIAFYTKFGFKQLYIRRHYYGRNRDAIIMKKEGDVC
ncbi:GNAT family N-acetyltransferase [Erysipelothrix larvae]|nr:GNAT family N-acetyltransferase [Erysipelothrix larvae]